MPRPRSAFTLLAALGIVGTVWAVTILDDAPDSQENTVTGVIETADTPWSGTNYDIRHVSAAGGGLPQVITTLTTDSRNDLGARLAINTANGDSWVAWWRDAVIDQVLVRKRDHATGGWSAERVQSASSEGSRRPSVAFDGSHAWIAYETSAAGGGTVLKAKYIEDDPAPFLTATIVATTSYTGTPQPRIQAESGRLWLTWVNSATHVGWSRFDPGTATWLTPAFESYETDSVEDARARIRLTVLAN